MKFSELDIADGQTINITDVLTIYKYMNFDFDQYSIHCGEEEVCMLFSDGDVSHIENEELFDAYADDIYSFIEK